MCTLKFDCAAFGIVRTSPISLPLSLRRPPLHHLLSLSFQRCKRSATAWDLGCLQLLPSSARVPFMCLLCWCMSVDSVDVLLLQSEVAKAVLCLTLAGAECVPAAALQLLPQSPLSALSSLCYPHSVLSAIPHSQHSQVSCTHCTRRALYPLSLLVGAPHVLWPSVLRLHFHADAGCKTLMRGSACPEASRLLARCPRSRLNLGRGPCVKASAFNASARLQLH